MSVINRKVIPNNVNDDLVNEKIRFKEVLVINSDGEQLGIKMRREALDIADVYKRQGNGPGERSAGEGSSGIADLYR